MEPFNLDRRDTMRVATEAVLATAHSQESLTLQQVHRIADEHLREIGDLSHARISEQTLRMALRDSENWHTRDVTDGELPPELMSRQLYSLNPDLRRWSPAVAQMIAPIPSARPHVSSGIKRPRGPRRKVSSVTDIPETPVPKKSDGGDRASVIITLIQQLAADAAPAGLEQNLRRENLALRLHAAKLEEELAEIRETLSKLLK